MFSRIHLPICMWALPCQCVFYNNDFTSLLKGRLSLLPTICPISASKMSPQPVCFSNWPLLMKPSVEFRPVQNCRSQMCQVILKPHKNTADITVQIAGNYDSSSRGKYAQISSYNWSLLKIKAVWRFNTFCLCSAKGTHFQFRTTSVVPYQMHTLSLYLVDLQFDL